jgi:hypothetical protein
MVLRVMVRYVTLSAIMKNMITLNPLKVGATTTNHHHLFDRTLG